LHQLYLRAGRTTLANAALSRTRHEAALSVIPQAILTIFVIALLLLGVVALIGMASRRFEPRRSDADTRPPDADLFGFFAVPLPVPITDADRRLRPRDLMDAFAVFLLMLNVVSYGVSALAVALLRPHLTTLSPIELNYANILISAVGYVGGGGAAVVYLLARARATGASLAMELGLNRASLAANLGFGLVGWGMALLLVLVVSKISGWALRAAPAPSNPALPLLISAPDIFTQVLLYALVAIAAPFFEELFFRGALLNALLPRFGPVVSIGLTGLLFGMVHPVGIAEVFSLATLGMVMAWAAYTRKSLVPSMMMHWLQNSFSYFTLYLTFLTITHR
jgi:membrane protease YdiL (CAAX protease family)